MFTIEQVQSLNELEMEVYQYVMKHQSAVRYMRIRELASEAHVSTTTVLRFCKKMEMVIMKNLHKAWNGC